MYIVGSVCRLTDWRCSFERLARPMRAAVLSAQRLQRNVSCDPDTTLSSSSSSRLFDEALQRADKTRFISAVSQSVDRGYTDTWMQHMTANLARSDAGQQRGSKWGRTQLTLATIGRPIISLLGLLRK